MTAYADLPEFVDQLEANSHKPEDDTYIEALLERCSREFDADTQHWFYASSQTRSYDMPNGRCLELDAPLLAVTSVTNGDGSAVTSDQYVLWPYNLPQKSEIRLKAAASVYWTFTDAGDREAAITVAGSFGYVDRDATDPVSLSVIANTKTAVLALATNVYRKRYGVGTEGVATVTGAGVVITPREKSREYWALVELYRRHL